jgi:glycosyltransferase involved in cell wall biosynthesis
VSADVLRNAYWASDIGLLPSRFEGFGLVVAEAMCCGCVPVRTPSGGCEDQILDGSNGFVIPFNNPLALAARISDLADPERRLAMREAAINYASQHLSQDRMIAAIAGVYRDAACAGRTSGG